MGWSFIASSVKPIPLMLSQNLVGVVGLVVNVEAVDLQ